MEREPDAVEEITRAAPGVCLAALLLIVPGPVSAKGPPPASGAPATRPASGDEAPTPVPPDRQAGFVGTVMTKAEFLKAACVDKPDPMRKEAKPAGGAASGMDGALKPGDPASGAPARNRSAPAASSAGKAKASRPPSRPSVLPGATIVSVKGAAQKLVLRGQKVKWAPIRAGETLREFTVLRTGLGAEIKLRFSGGGSAVIGSNTKMGIVDLSGSDEANLARLTLSYGKISLYRSRIQGRGAMRVDTRGGGMQLVGKRGEVSYEFRRSVQVEGDAGAWQRLRPLEPGSRGMQSGLGEADLRRMLRERAAGLRQFADFQDTVTDLRRRAAELSDAVRSKVELRGPGGGR